MVWSFEKKEFWEKMRKSQNFKVVPKKIRMVQFCSSFDSINRSTKFELNQRKAISNGVPLGAQLWFCRITSNHSPGSFSKTYFQQFRIVVANFALVLRKVRVLAANLEASVVPVEVFHVQRQVRHPPPAGIGEPVAVRQHQQQQLDGLSLDRPTPPSSTTSTWPDQAEKCRPRTQQKHVR